MTPTTRTNIRNHIKAGYPALYLVTHEDQRAEADIKAVASELKYQLASWSIVSGVSVINDGSVSPTANTQAPEAAIEWMNDASEQTILILSDFHMMFSGDNPLLVRTMKESLWMCKSHSKCIIIIGCRLQVPPEIEKLVTLIDYTLPNRAQIGDILNRVSTDNDIAIDGEVDDVINAATGLSTTEAEDAFALSAVECGKIRADVVQREKSATIKKGGLLEVLEAGNGISEIGGLDDLKSWIGKRRNAFSEEAKTYGLPNPRGVLLIGPAGTGKTLTCMAIASALRVPLLKLDCGSVMAGIVGESESNMRSVIRTAEAIAPCVLLVDELEKQAAGGKSSGHTDGGTTSRVIGTLLQWLSSKTSPVFVVATSNDVSSLPPEMLRKGRFDEMWFVDLPNKDERKEIWGIQIKKNGRKPKQYDLDKLASITDGWTGAEIESLFRESMFAAFDLGQEPTTSMIESLSRQSVPLSVTMKEQIEGIRSWANGRARRATSLKTEEQKAGRKINV